MNKTRECVAGRISAQEIGSKVVQPEGKWHWVENNGYTRKERKI